MALIQYNISHTILSHGILHYTHAKCLGCYRYTSVQKELAHSGKEIGRNPVVVASSRVCGNLFAFYLFKIFCIRFIELAVFDPPKNIFQSILTHGSNKIIAIHSLYLGYLFEGGEGSFDILHVSIAP